MPKRKGWSDQRFGRLVAFSFVTIPKRLPKRQLVTALFSQTGGQAESVSVQALRKGHASLIRRPHIGREIL